MASGSEDLVVRSATHGDLVAVTETISLAFHEDPTWSWAFPDPVRRHEQYGVFWRFMIEGALRYPWVLMTNGCEAASVWIPPGGTEIAARDEARVEPLLKNLVGIRRGDALELLDRFDKAHPREEPHFYLSLLGTHPAHAGRGLGRRCSLRTSRGSTGNGCPLISNRATRPTTTAMSDSASGRSASSIPLEVTHP
jgi:hypothetical protein